MHRCLRALAGLLVGAVGVVLPIAAAAAADETADVGVTRYGGADRYATSLQVAEALAARADGSFSTVVMVSGREWTDAVVAAPLAGSMGVPVLATPSDHLRPDAAAFLLRVGASKVVIVGTDSDMAGVGPAVVSALKQMGISTRRITRADQYSTGVAVADALGTPGDMGEFGRTAIVANGEVFADALVAGAFAARGPHPVLLTPPDRLHPGVADYLTRAQIEHVVLMGGKVALHQGVANVIRSMDVRVTRLSGATRYDTAVAAAGLIAGKYGDGCFTTRRFGMARARVPFDSFSAAPLLGRLCAPLLLADPHAIPRTTAATLNRALGLPATGPTNSIDLYVFGGSAAVSSFAINNYLADPLGTEGGRLRPSQPCVPALASEPIPVLGDVHSVRAAWSPDCSKIAYTGWIDRWIPAFYVASVDGSDRVMVFDHGAGAPAWSPDGTKIAFSRYAGRRVGGESITHIFLANPDGSALRQLTSGDFQDRSPSWSPDGKRIVFSREDPRNKHRYQNYDDVFIAVMDADGRNVTALTRGGVADHSPAWSPDGQWIAYDRNQDLWVMDPQGGNAREVASLYSPNGHTWSPDSKFIAYTTFEFVEDDTYSGGKRDDRTITISSLDGAKKVEVVRYVSHPVNNSSRGTFTIIRWPQWAPDGRGILYERNTHMGDAARAYVAPVPTLQ